MSEQQRCNEINQVLWKTHIEVIGEPDSLLTYFGSQERIDEHKYEMYCKVNARLMNKD